MKIPVTPFTLLDWGAMQGESIPGKTGLLH